MKRMIVRIATRKLLLFGMLIFVWGQSPLGKNDRSFKKGWVGPSRRDEVVLPEGMRGSFQKGILKKSGILINV